jgi:hypothetical protein
LVREACVLLAAMATAAGDGMRVLMRDITPVMMQLVGSGNSVSAYNSLIIKSCSNGVEKKCSSIYICSQLLHTSLRTQ